ncbi:MAG: hypothetical protein GXY86_02705 [Firmicutes bacterium]|nr:hypothetical protein [Bacillota bacterium]
MNKKLIYSGLAIIILITAGLIYRFYPYFLYKNNGFAQAETESVQEPNKPLSLSDYQNYLNSLDRSKPIAVASGIRVLGKSIPFYSLTEADQSFLAFNTYFIEALNHCNETFWQNESLLSKLNKATQGLSTHEAFEYLNKPSSNQKDSEIRSLVEQVSSCGFVIIKREGNFYFDENSDFLYNHFSKYLSISLRDFLNLRRQEAAEGFTEDSNLMISFTKIGERIIDWENYLNKYPDSPLKELANFHCQLYLGTFLFGIANTETFERKRLKPELRQIYESFIDQYPQSKSANLISGYYEVLRANDFKFTKAAENFLRDNRIHILPGFEP